MRRRLSDRKVLEHVVSNWHRRDAGMALSIQRTAMFLWLAFVGVLVTLGLYAIVVGLQRAEEKGQRCTEGAAVECPQDADARPGREGDDVVHDASLPHRQGARYVQGGAR